MVAKVLKKIFGTANDRYIKSLAPTIDAINSLEAEFKKLSDEGLQAKTIEFRSRLEKGEKLDAILPEAFATVREAAKRTLGQRHYDVQLIGGIILHQGKIAEMKTGEGKTLVGTLAVYLNALSGKGVHVVTVNDYLASRDAGWMGQVYEFLGLSVGVILHGQTPQEKQEAYAADVTYGTNNEFGFDYLRDNMRFSIDEMAQKPFNFAIVDEVDSILIDEARTPLIISGPVEDRTDLYIKINNFIPKLVEEDYEKDEKANSIALTDEGIIHLEKLYREQGVIHEDSTLFDIENITVLHHTQQALKAHKMFAKDKDYLVKDGKIYIIDEFTGRIMEGRRFSDGLHQALEAREGVPIQNENQTLASITFQNYFRMYPKLSGMTGTAMTEASEFADIYKLEVVEIPTHKPVSRIDDDDSIYRTEEEKFQAIANLIVEANKKGQPVLAGTASVEKSELLSKFLKKNKITHNILNAKQHTKEAYVIAQAGQVGAVTVATNMAGRGTDIQLGGNLEMLIENKVGDEKNASKIKKIEEKLKAEVEVGKAKVLEAGGLCVVGTERHESRRIDNQLRGRSGRQGDPGYSKFYLSAEDDLIRVFGADKKMDWILSKMGEEGEPIEHPMINRMMEKAQAKVEGHNYEIRKTLLKFDDVMNDQRKVVYDQRVNLMKSDDVRERLSEMLDEVVDGLVSTYIPANSYQEKWEVESLENEVFRIFGEHLPVKDWAADEGAADEEIFEKIATDLDDKLKSRDEKYGEVPMKSLEKRILLFTLDEVWKDHLHFLDQLRQGINLRAYGQKDPLNEYKKEAFDGFRSMLALLSEKFLSRLFRVNIQAEDEMETVLDEQQGSQKTNETHFDPAASGSQNTINPGARPSKVTIRSHVSAKDRDPANPATWGKVARNELCPCGSGKKYKQCHGKVS